LTNDCARAAGADSNTVTATVAANNFETIWIALPEFGGKLDGAGPWVNPNNLREIRVSAAGARRGQDAPDPPGPARF
jgi:hypothetical protein